MYTKDKVAQAETDAAASAARGEENYAASQAVRSGKVVAHFDEDPDGKKWHQAIVVNAPVQVFINKAFAAQGASRKCIAVALEAPAEATESYYQRRSNEFDGYMQEARRKMLEIIDGTAARRVQTDLTAMLVDMEGGPWSQVHWTREEKFRTAKLVCCEITAAWKRLEVYARQPKFEILAGCAHAYNAADLADLTNPLHLKSEECEQCVDKAFSKLWLGRLRGDRKKSFHSKLQQALPLLPVTSTIIESKHPLGQEIKALKRRGCAVRPQTLSTKTYRKFMQLLTLR